MTDRFTLSGLHLWAVMALIAASAVPELILLGSDWGLWGSARWRSLTYQYGAFWSGLLLGWTPNYAAQPYAMFATYAFLHAGPGHLLVNMITLYTLGKSIAEKLGPLRFLTVYALSALGGALVFGLFGTVFQPMVGASGALFGLAGAWVVLDVSAAVKVRPGFRGLAYAVLWPIMVLLLLNLVMLWSTSGQLAWETHLGGFLVGAIVTVVLRRKRTSHL